MSSGNSGESAFRFRADFPGAEAAHGYYVTPVKRDILASARLQAPAPTYVVLTALYESPQQASAAAVLSASVDRLKPATIDGFRGYQAVSPVPSQLGATNPLHVVESISLLARGDQLFTSYAFTLTARTALAFTHSIRVLIGAAAVATASAAAVPPAVKAQGGGHKNAEIFGGLLVVLLLAGAGYWYVQRRRASEAAPPPISAMACSQREPGTPSSAGCMTLRPTRHHQRPRPRLKPSTRVRPKPAGSQLVAGGKRERRLGPLYGT